jgi:hypothetical protein
MHVALLVVIVCSVVQFLCCVMCVGVGCSGVGRERSSLAQQAFSCKQQLIVGLRARSWGLGETPHPHCVVCVAVFCIMVCLVVCLFGLVLCFVGCVMSLGVWYGVVAPLS